MLEHDVAHWCQDTLCREGGERRSEEKEEGEKRKEKREGEEEEVREERKKGKRREVAHQITIMKILKVMKEQNSLGKEIFETVRQFRGEGGRVADVYLTHRQTQDYHALHEGGRGRDDTFTRRTAIPGAQYIQAVLPISGCPLSSLLSFLLPPVAMPPTPPPHRY